MDVDQKEEKPKNTNVDSENKDTPAEMGEKEGKQEDAKMEMETPAEKSTENVEKPAEKPEELVKREEEKTKEEETKAKVEDEWFDVAMVKGTKYEIKHFFVPAESGEELTDDEKLFLDPESVWKKKYLLSGIMYKVRICGINSCGRSPFSDFSAYKTNVPGFPGAPSSIKVSKTDNGAALSWMPPQNTDIIEYSVYLAVKQVSTSGKANNFIRVYLGHEPSCIVSHNQLAQAATNTESSNKPAVIFRIAAKNKMGYGPATQVRWLQDAKTKRQAAANNKEQIKKAKN